MTPLAGAVTERSAVMERLLELEEARQAAMLSADIAALDTLLHERLVYVHSGGVTDSKQSYLEGLRRGTWTYRRIERTQQRFVDYGDTVLLFCKLEMDMAIAGVERSFGIRALIVWKLGAGGWKVIGVHSSAAD